MNFSLDKIELYLEQKNIEALRYLIDKHDLELVEGKLRAKDTSNALYLSQHYNHLQQAQKIRLNALYGSLLNGSCRFHDERLGKSVTLTGRSIVRHMNAKVNEIITGVYDYKGAAICAVDTDSCYFTAYDVLRNEPQYTEVEWTREFIIQLYDAIADEANDSFPEFMHKSFGVTLEKGAKIKAGRELIASKALFIKKKKYAALVFDKEGTRLDVDGKPGALKITGLDIKRSDTPKTVQVFLEALLMNILTDVPESKMFDDIRQFRKDFKARPGWEKGSPKKVNALSTFGDAESAAQQGATKGRIFKKGEKGKINMPGHVRAALNWNALCDLNGDKYSTKIQDGAKCIVVKLKPNVMKMDSVAYPIDQLFLPDWFKKLPFDHAAMEETIIDKKISNLVGVLGWDLTLTKERGGEQFLRFV